MRKLKYLILLIALVCTTTAWAEDFNDMFNQIFKEEVGKFEIVSFENGDQE